MKKKIIISIVIVLFLVAGGFFWWWQSREIKGRPEDYVIKETPEGKFVENKRAGLSIKVPEGWEAKRIEVDKGFVIFYPSFTEIEQQNKRINLPLKHGCIVDVSVIYEKMDFSAIKLDVWYALSGLGVTFQEFEEVIIDNHPGLKNTFDTQKIGEGVGINIPYGDKVYAFYLYWGPEEKEICIKEFDNFLEKISIK
ncbi:MAG: hypothetical protein QME57_00575 [Patescibacteria group bacterium]|nr:hypothetical protein [Patescibacteria group bacterium]